MKRLEEFLSKQYDLTLWTKVIYGSAVLAFEGVSGSDFEEAHLDEGVVMRVLGVLSDRLSPST